MIKKTLQNKIQNLIKPIFKATKYVLRVFVDPARTAQTLLALILVFVLVSSSYTQVQASTPKKFKPTQVALNVFPTAVSSDTWGNISTVGSQDLGENSLFQDFDASNSAYLGSKVRIPKTEPVREEPGPVVDVSETDPDTDAGAHTNLDADTSDTPPTPVEDTANDSSSDVESTTEPALDDIVDQDIEEPAAEEVPAAGGESAVVSSPLIFSVIKFLRNTFELAVAEIIKPIPNASAQVVAEPEVTEPEVTAVPVVVTETVPEIVEEPELVVPGPVPETEVVTPVVEEVPSGSLPDIETEEETSEVVEEAVTEEVLPMPHTGPAHTISFSGFGVPNFESGQFIDNLQLRLSLAGDYEANTDELLPSLKISYSFETFSGEAGTVLLDDEISNALNGGYYLIPFPQISDPELLSDLTISVTFDGDMERLSSLYLDAAWLEVTTLVYSKELLLERFSLEEMYKHLKAPDIMEFLSDQIDFGRDELPRFNLKYISQRNALVQALRSLFASELATIDEVVFSRNGNVEKEIAPDVSITNDGLISISLSEEDAEVLKPGTYEVDITINEGGELTTDTFEFQWGLLTINTNQTEYGSAEVVDISMGALTSNGNTICDADLNLYITDPTGFISNVPVATSGQCFGNNVIDVPDYSTQFVTDTFGEYEMYLEKVDESGSVVSHITETFLVVPNQEIVIGRTGPTRIFPPAKYGVELSVHALTKSFNGQLIERVPIGFEIFDTDAEIREQEGFKELIWDVSMLSGNTETFTYTFDAPDISPYLFNLGAAKLVTDEEVVTTSMVEVVPEVDPNSTSTEEVAPVFEETTTTSLQETVIFEEHRRWQIASDALQPGVPALADMPAFDNVQATSTTPSIGGFAAYDPDGDVVEYEIQIDDDINFGSVNVSAGSVNFPTDSGWNASTFASGATTTYSVLPAAALTDGVTYWWRVRAKDPTDTNTWTNFSAPRSISINTSSVASRWYQTLGHQFSRSTLVGLSTTTGAVSLPVTTTVPTLVSGWTVNSVNPGATLTLTKPASVQPGDLLIIIVGDEDTTNTAQWNNTTNKPTGFTLIQEGGNATSDAHAAAFYRVADGTEGVTVDVPSQSSDGYWGYYIRVTGADPLNPINTVGAVTNTGNSTSKTAASIATTVDNALAFYVLASDGGDNDPFSISGTGWVEADETESGPTANDASGVWGTRAMGAAGATGNATIGMSASDGATTFQFAITPAPIDYGTIMSTEIDFDWVPGQSTWGDISWTVTQPVDTLTELQVYYSNVTACDTIVPDLDLPGNSAGFASTTSGLLIYGLSTSTYNKICLKMTLDLNTGASSPTLNDWTVRFDLPNQPPLAPVLSNTPAFDFLYATSTPRLGAFAATDYESETMEYQIVIDNDYDFSSPAITKQSSDYPVDAGWSAATFAAGATTTYKIQLADALTSGVTYWYKIRARDPLGTNTWGPYSAVRSTTVDTSLIQLGWHQTLGYQFGAGLLTNISTTTSGAEIDVIGLGSVLTTDTFESLADANTTFAGTTIWKQATVSTDDGSWQAETAGTASGTTGPNAASEGGVFIYTEASAGGACDNTIANNNCAIEADITDGTLDGIQFDYHMFGDNMGTLSLDLYDGLVWTTVWSRTGAQSVDELDWLDSGYLDLVPYKEDTTIMRFFADGDGGGWSGDFALDNIRISTSTPSTGVLLSSEVDFSWVPDDSDWGLVEWDVTEPVGTDTRMRVYYSDAGVCDTMVPNILLPGNAAGFDKLSSPIFIDGLSTTTYNKLCLRMTLDAGGTASSPVLENWSVKWVIPNQTPSAPAYDVLPAFNNMKSSTTEPVFGGFSSTDYEDDSVEYQIVIDDDYAFSSPALTKQSSDYPTDAGWSATTFSVGATTTYAIQSGDSLTAGTTYWWRVRARDPLGSNEWSEYSSPKSVTISSVLNYPEWYQTTSNQFLTSFTSKGNATSTPGGVTLTSSTSSVSLLDPWSTGNTKTISDGTNRLLLVAIISEDPGINTNVNTVTYGGQLMTQIEDQNIGTGFSNGMWVGYLNEAGIAAAVGNTITPTWVGGVPGNGIGYNVATFNNVSQSSPVRDKSYNAYTSGQNTTPTAAISAIAGDMMVYFSETAQGITHTAATGYTEGIEQEVVISGDEFTHASAYKRITASGSEYPTAIWSATGNRLLMVALNLAPSPATASIMSPEVDFDWVAGQSDWGEIIWNVSEPAGSDSVIQVYYSNAGVCDTLIPNGTLAGNAAGFDAADSPIDIAALSTSTYNRICLKSTLSHGTVSSASLLDWGISWEQSAVFEQSGYRWYVNNNSITPTDTWPAGATAFELAENQPVNTAQPTQTGDLLRLRMGARVSSVSATANQFKLQYSEAVAETCSADSTWYDVAPISSSTALWKGYNNASVTDGATLPISLLSLTNVLQTYEEENTTSVIPNVINVGQYAEWDWVLENKAIPGISYCFRMTTPDGKRFKTYTNYPKLSTNKAPTIASTESPFDNEKLADTTPEFVFTGVDTEGNSVDYQVQIDNDVDFSSSVIDHNSISNFTYFNNVQTPADKSPFNQSEKISYVVPSALSNGVTYWWRVRAIDPDNSATYGPWSTLKSFTVDTSVTITTWFQTTEEQFNTDTLEGTDATVADRVSFAGGFSVGTTTSTAIDFDDLTTGNAWGQLLFTETGAANDILYHMEYYDGYNWLLIPDGALSGNVAGYDNSPIDLIDLDTETYNQIRIRANFLNGFPSLDDWTITWGERVSVPTHFSLFDNEKTDNTLPTFTFLSTDPQSDDLVYEFSYSTDNTFVSSTTVNSAVAPGFVNLANGADTSPFTSGDTISYTVQSALSDNVTYWWRTRAKDPVGGDSYSFWSDPWSFTISAAATTSTWFQTTEEQFNTDTLISLATLGADSVTTIPATVSNYNFLGVTGPSATHIARDFEVDVLDPTDPPTLDAIDTLTISGTSDGSPNLRSGIAGYASDAEATTAQYTSLNASDNNRWTITDPGVGDNAVFWAKFHVDEVADNISQLDILLEGYQGLATDVAWLGIWRPGTTTPYWQDLSHSQQTADFNYTGSITSNITEYLDGNNDVHIIFFNEDDDDSLFVDFVQLTVTSDNATEGKLTGTDLDFNDGSGPAWGQMTWSDTKPGASTVEYQVEYLNGVGVWELIPDAALPGNAAGFTSSPVDLKYLNTTIYNEIRPVANLTCAGASCPTVNDWTIEWSRGFTVSGTAFEYGGVASTTSGTVAVAVNGALQIGKTGTISASGVWTIDNVTYFSGDIVTVFVSGAADADEAVAITKYDGTPDITGMKLQKRHLTIGSNDSASLSNINIGLYDVAEDEDIFYSVDGGNDLNLCTDVACSDAGLVVLAGNTYTPAAGADLVTHDFVNNGTVTLSNNTWRVSGSYDNNATTTMGASTVIMTATSTSETIDSTGATSAAFNNLTLGETSGTATWTLNSSLVVSGDMLTTYGTLARGIQSISIAKNLTVGATGFWTGIGTTTFDGINPTTWTDNNGTDQNIGRVVVDGTSKTMVMSTSGIVQSMNIGANDIFDLNGKTLTVNENWLNQNTFNANLGTVVFASTAAGRTITTNGSSFYNATFNGVGGAWAFTNPTLSVLNNLTISNGTLTLPTATTTITGSFDSTGGLFAHNNGTLLFNSNAAKTVTFAGGAFTNTAYNMVFNGAGSWLITDTNATSSNDVVVKSGTLTLPSGVMAIGGALIDNGGSYNPQTGTVNFYSSVAKILSAGGSNFYNVNFSGVGSWSFTDTNFTTLSNFTVSQGTLTFPNGTSTIGGSYTNLATVVPGTGTVEFNAASTGKTVSFGNSALYNVSFTGATGGWTLNSSATTTNNFSLVNAGSWTLNTGQILSVGGLFTNSVGGASTTWTGSTLNLSGSDHQINSKVSNGDVYATLQTFGDTDISMWNSSSTSIITDGTSSIYSQDHAGVDGNLYIFGNYTRTSGTEYWSRATDFDGADLTGFERTANVRVASSSVIGLENSSFNITGGASASTTISSLSGTFGLSASNTAITAQYFTVAGTNSQGFVMTASTTVPIFSDGFFNITPASSGITVDASTVDSNVTKQIFGVSFATTTAGTATNVTQNGGTPVSNWWFRDGAGSLYGEAYDNDTGDPGSIRFDDSSLTITVSGVVYSDAGLTPLLGGTCDSSTPVVRVVVNGGTSYTGSCSNTDGSFSIAGVAVVGDPTLTVYLDNALGGEKGSVVTRTPTGNISNLDIYVNRVIVRNEDAAPTSIINFAEYDGMSDSDIQFVASTATSPYSLVVNSGSELFVYSSSTFTPLGNIEIVGNAVGNSYDGSLYLDTNSTFNAYSTSTYIIGGRFVLNTGAIFSPASSTVVMNATTTGKSITASSTITLNNLTFNGVGGSWNIGANLLVLGDVEVANGVVTGTSDISLINGSITGNGMLSLGGGTVTLSSSNTLGGTNSWTFYNLVLGNGLVAATTTPFGVATTTVSGLLTVANAHTLDAGSSIWDLSGTGNVFVQTGNLAEGTSTFRYSGAGANVLPTTYYNLLISAGVGSANYTATGGSLLVRSNLTIGGATNSILNVNTSDPVLEVRGDVQINSNGTLEASNSAAFNVLGNWTNLGTFNNNSGTVNFTGTATSNIAAGNSSFSNVIVNGTGNFNVTENATSTGAFTLTNHGVFTVNSGQRLAVGGLFTNTLGGAATTWTGSTLSLYGAGNYSINASSTSDTYETLAIGSGTQVKMWNSDASVYNVNSNGSLYSQDHATVDGDLYIWGKLSRTTGSDYWSYARDFDGTDLTGGSERVANVYFGSGSSAAWSGASLTAIGATGATTTIQNQGSGTYGLTVGTGSTINWDRVQVRNTDISGVVLSGSAAVTGFSRTDHYVVLNSGSAITLGGTVINANPAKNFTNNVFATDGVATSPINVTATGTAVSSWRFTNHTGNIAGEAYDSDPAGDPGYVVWDNSAALITVAGNVYSDEGVTVSPVCDGVTNNIRLVVAGITTYDTTCSVVTGAYSITNVAFGPVDTLTLYINDETQKAVNVTVAPISSISNMNLYENRVIVRHENTDPLTIANMAIWDSSDDADIQFTAVDAGADTLTLPANNKLLIWTGKTFEPNGNITLAGGAGTAYNGMLEAQDSATFRAINTENHTIGGSVVFGIGAVYTSASSTLTLTTTGAGRTFDVNGAAVNNLTVTGSGSWNMTDSTFTAAGSYTQSAGTVTFPAGTSTIGAAFDATGGTFLNNGSPFLFTSSGAGNTVRFNNSLVSSLDFTGTGSWNMTDTNATSTGSVTINSGTLTLPSGNFAVGGDFEKLAGNIVHNTSDIIMTATTTAVVTASSSDLYAIKFTGPAAYTITDTNITFLDSFTIASGSVLVGTGTMSVGGSFIVTGGTFDNASGTVLMNASASGKTINPGTSPFYNLQIGAPSGGYTMFSATTTNNFTLTGANIFTANPGSVIAVGGVFSNTVGGVATTWTNSTLNLNGSAAYSINSRANAGDVYGTLVIGPNLDIKTWYSSAATTTVDVTSSLYSQDNANVNGALHIYGDLVIATTTEYWNYARDFDGTDLSGSERKVTVSFAPNATTTVTTGSLQMLGDSGFVTSVKNQGVGTYALVVNGGALNANYYELTNLNALGLQLKGLSTITNLANGYYDLSVDTGSLISLASTTLNANASKIFNNVGFNATTSLTGTNVNLSGSTVNAWRFTNSYGNIDGEIFDVDGIDDCGSIRFDDSSCLLTEQTHYRWRNDDGGEGVTASEWFDIGWDARKSVRVVNADATTYTNAAVQLFVNYDSDMQADFGDLYFTSSNGVTPVPFWISSTTNSGVAEVWVKVASLPASDMATLYMYYKNPTATTTYSSSTEVFIASDSFEDGNISEYSGQTSLFSANTAFNYDASYGLDNNGFESSRTNLGGIYRNDQTVSQGQTFRYLQYVDTTAGSGDEVCTKFGVATGAPNSNYAVCLEQFGVDRISLVKNVVDNDSSGTVLATSTVSFTTGWYEVEVDWGTDNSFYVSLSNMAGTVVASVTASDSTYTSGGYGFSFWFHNGGWDAVSSRPMLVNEPQIFFGAEQADGGASWLAARNTAGLADPNDVVRLRVAVENSGLDITGHQYRLEYAAKGVAPTCESVDTGTYAVVPNQASCGSSPICMQTSIFVSDGDTTTDKLIGTNGQFTAGRIVTSPSNQASSLNIDQDNFTEMEYILSPTNNASDDYCFRVTNAGTELDFYANIAQLSLRFEPTFGAVALNAGSPISLTPGTTTAVTVLGTVTDVNGYTDLAHATATIYRSGAGASCTPDNNNCYIANTDSGMCTFTSCAGNSCQLSCTVDVFFHADPTDASTYEGEEWLAYAEASDFAGGYDFASALGVELITLRALNVDSLINYGSLEADSDTGAFNPSSTITNLGNVPINIDIEGTNLTDGNSSSIPAAEQKVATSTFTYNSCITCQQLSTSTPVMVGINLGKPSDIFPPTVTDVYWGIAVPFSASAAPHSGTNIFTPIGVD